MKLEPYWSVADIYNLMRNGIFMFQYRHDFFNRYLKRTQDLALSVRLTDTPRVCLKSMLYCREENSLIGFENDLSDDQDKSFDQVLMDLKQDELGQREKVSIKQIIDRSKLLLRKYVDKYDPGIELDRIRKSEQKDSVDGLSSCLAVTWMALYTCKAFWPLNTQLVSYCLLVAREIKSRGRLLKILTGEGKSCVIAMVAATYALLGRTVDIVTSSPVLSQRDAEEW